MTSPVISPSSWKWSLGIGIAMLVIGFIAMGNLIVATAASIYLVGVVMLVGGVLQLIHGFRQHQRKAFWIISGLLYAIAGIFAISNPFAFSSVLTLWLGIVLIFVGISRLLSIPSSVPGRGCMLFSSILTLLLGLVLVLGWPANSLWVIGMFLAFDLVFQGWSYLLLGLALKNRT